MLDKETITVHSKTEFDEIIGKKQYFVNMNSNTRTLHRMGFKSCPYAKMADKFIAFMTEEEVYEFEKKHRNETPFKRCGNCFKG